MGTVLEGRKDVFRHRQEGCLAVEKPRAILGKVVTVTEKECGS